MSYLLWELWEWDLAWLRQSLEYFQESYILWKDQRTLHNIEVLEKLLNQEMEMQSEPEEPSEENKNWDTEESSNWDESWDTSKDAENNNWNSVDEMRENNWNSGEVQSQSEPLFHELWFNSEQELLDELERYTEELLERQNNNMWQLRRNYDDFNAPIEDFFFQGNPFFQDLREQWEKDW